MHPKKKKKKRIMIKLHEKTAFERDRTKPILNIWKKNLGIQKNFKTEFKNEKLFKTKHQKSIAFSSHFNISL